METRELHMRLSKRLSLIEPEAAKAAICRPPRVQSHGSIDRLEGRHIVSKELCEKRGGAMTKGRDHNAPDMREGACQSFVPEDSVGETVQGCGNLSDGHPAMSQHESNEDGEATTKAAPKTLTSPETEHKSLMTDFEKPTVCPNVVTGGRDAFVTAGETISCKEIDNGLSFEDIPDRGTADSGKTKHEAMARLNGSTVIYFRTLSRRGETVLDPVLAELLFIRRWKRLGLRLVPSNYPHLCATGELPACFSPEGLVRRPQLLQTLRHWTGCSGLSTTEGSSAKAEPVEDRIPPVTDVGWRCFLEQRVGVPVQILLWRDEAVYAKHTQPALLGTTPWGFGWYLTWSLRRQKLQSCSSAVDDAGLLVILAELDKSLTVLEERLGNAQSFGDKLRNFTYLDACAYGHLSVLYSISCERGSPFHTLLLRHRSLADFCARMELRLGAWPEPRTFLAALEPEEQLPAWRDACNMPELKDAFC